MMTATAQKEKPYLHCGPFRIKSTDVLKKTVSRETRKLCKDYN